MSLHKTITKFKTAALSLVFAVSAVLGVVSTALPAHAAALLGGVDLQTYYCDVYHPGTAAVILNTQHNAVGWRCAYDAGGTTILYTISVNTACSNEYGSGAYGAYSDYNNPYSWKCYR